MQNINMKDAMQVEKVLQVHFWITVELRLSEAQFHLSNCILIAYLLFPKLVVNGNSFQKHPFCTEYSWEICKGINCCAVFVGRIVWQLPYVMSTCVAVLEIEWNSTWVTFKKFELVLRAKNLAWLESLLCCCDIVIATGGLAWIENVPLINNNVH